MTTGSRSPRSRTPPPIRYRGTTLGSQALTQIRRIIRECGGLTRTHISRRVCQYFGWRCSGGGLPVHSVVGLLVRLERDGRIRLPASRRPPVRRRSVRRPVAEDAIIPEFAQPDAEAGDLVVRLVQPNEREAYRALLDRHHYLGWRQPPGSTLAHVAFFERKPVALVSWATASLHNQARDAWIGWDDAARSRNLRFVANNVRFLVLPHADGDQTRRNLASRVLGASLKRLSRDWQQIHGYPILVAETFVDATRFRGTCYRASNWTRVGTTIGWSRRGKIYSFHGRPKDVFVIPLHRRAREWLRITDNIYNLRERGAQSMIIDVNRLPLEGDDGLFAVLGSIKDPRNRRGVRHKAAAALAMIATAVLAGAKSFAAIAQWIEDLPGEMRERLGGSRYRKPSVSTVRRLLIAIDVRELDRQLGDWTMRHRDLDLSGQGIAMDGKTLRGSRDGTSPPSHLVSVVLHRNAEVVSQTRVPDKSNEIKSVEPVLNGLNIEGAIVTGDAMFTQTAIAEHIVEQKNADYLATVKDNQLGLRVDIQNMGLESLSPSAHHDIPGTRAHREASDLGDGQDPARGVHSLPARSPGVSHRDARRDQEA